MADCKVNNLTVRVTLGQSSLLLLQGCEVGTNVGSCNNIAEEGGHIRVVGQEAAVISVDNLLEESEDGKNKNVRGADVLTGQEGLSLAVEDFVECGEESRRCLSLDFVVGGLLAVGVQGFVVHDSGDGRLQVEDGQCVALVQVRIFQSVELVKTELLSRVPCNGSGLCQLPLGVLVREHWYLSECECAFGLELGELSVLELVVVERLELAGLGEDETNREGASATRSLEV
mmetsp:Transcript_113/g.428  ORF Transcript_113/g.428 Transcript_113/m.428 type:complete len:230 (-) Transcript_113:104-793(-)